MPSCFNVLKGKVSPSFNLTPRHEYVKRISVYNYAFLTLALAGSE